MQSRSNWCTPLVAATALLCSLGAAGEDAPPAPAASAPPCAGAQYRQFDFWIGRWSVTEAGKPAGSNTIEPDLKRCALFESWTAVDGSRGRSINFYDRATGHWHQTWIDDRGGALELDGGLQGRAMVLEGERADPRDGARVRQRITWTPQADGSVRQHWQTLKAGNPAWETVFDGLYQNAR